MMDMLQTPRYNMRGKSRFIFFPMLLFILLYSSYLALTDLVFLRLGLNVFRDDPSATTVFYTFIVVLLMNLCWASFLLVYGMDFDSGRFIRLFATLALIQLLAAFCDLDKYNAIPEIEIRIPVKGTTTGFTLYLFQEISSLLSIIFSCTWIFVLITLIRNTKPRIALSISAILFIAYHIFTIIYVADEAFLMPLFVILRHHSQFDRVIISVLLFIQTKLSMRSLDLPGFAAILSGRGLTVVYCFIASFFFGALSFSKMKLSKAERYGYTLL